MHWIANYIWGIADDVLRDLYVRGKYRDVILPMTVLRRLDAVLEDSKQAVLDMKTALDAAHVVEQDSALRQAAGQAFYNTSKFTLRDLRARASRQQLEADFRAYLDGFSPNVQDILDNFEFRNQIPRLSKADALGTLIERLTSPDINLSPHAVKNADGTVRHPGLDNHGMGSIFEELVRRFNEENNEEAGEHWTPRDGVRLMAKLVFLPVADEIKSATYLLYDGACGTGGMLTVAEETLKQLAAEHGNDVSTHLYGQEINAETYAICKADLLLKGDGEAADNIVGGPEHSTLTNDAFLSREFDFMLSNPPYGKSWKTDMDRMGGKKDMRDPRFVIEHAGDPEYSMVTRSSDGQMLFLANKLSKMKQDTPLGSRIAEVHNGSSLFTGDAGQGESNIRRWIIEHDWLEAIVALPLNMFYNTGIATYVWVLTNRKPEHRRGKVQLIDATKWYQPLRKNLGKKNCELGDDDISRICETFLSFAEAEQSRIFPNEAFGYWKVTVDRPLRLTALVHGSRALGAPRSTSWPSWRQQAHDRDMQSSVHPKYKTKYHVGTWPAYDRALVQRGDITVWLAPDAIATWEAVGVGKRGGQRQYSDLAIETALTLRLIFHLPLRQTEGFLTSIFGMLGLDLSAPDHTTLSRRGQHLDLPLRRAPAGTGLHLMVDSTGLSIVGEGAWAAAKDGGRGRRGWKKRHLGVDRSGVIVARALTEASVDDATTGITRIEATDGALGRVTADAAYETIGFDEAAGARGATVVVPPTRTAHVSRHGPRSSARDRTILAVKERGRRRWKKTSGYHGQARVENAFFRDKSIIGDSLRACSPAGRGTEVVLACNILNQMTGRGRPMSYRIGR